MKHSHHAFRQDITDKFIAFAKTWPHSTFKLNDMVKHQGLCDKTIVQRLLGYKVAPRRADPKNFARIYYITDLVEAIEREHETVVNREIVS